MLMVSTMPNQIGSKPAASMPGMITGVTIRMIATGGRKQPSTSSRMFTQKRYTHFDRPRPTSHCAMVCVMCR